MSRGGDVKMVEGQLKVTSNSISVIPVGYQMLPRERERFLRGEPINEVADASREVLCTDHAVDLAALLSSLDGRRVTVYVSDLGPGLHPDRAGLRFEVVEEITILDHDGKLVTLMQGDSRHVPYGVPAPLPPGTRYFATHVMHDGAAVPNGPPGRWILGQRGEYVVCLSEDYFKNLVRSKAIKVEEPAQPKAGQRP